jgi:hypothetical protein
LRSKARPDGTYGDEAREVVVLGDDDAAVGGNLDDWARQVDWNKVKGQGRDPII